MVKLNDIFKGERIPQEWLDYCNLTKGVMTKEIAPNTYQIVKIPELSDEAKAGQLKMIRQKYFEEIKWRVERAKEQEELGLKSDDDYKKLLKYKQYLRDITEDKNFPNIEIKTFEEYK